MLIAVGGSVPPPPPPKPPPKPPPSPPPPSRAAQPDYVGRTGSSAGIPGPGLGANAAVLGAYRLAWQAPMIAPPQREVVPGPVDPLASTFRRVAPSAPNGASCGASEKRTGTLRLAAKRVQGHVAAACSAIKAAAQAANAKKPEGAQAAFPAGARRFLSVLNQTIRTEVFGPAATSQTVPTGGVSIPTSYEVQQYLSGHFGKANAQETPGQRLANVLGVLGTADSYAVLSGLPNVSGLQGAFNELVKSGQFTPSEAATFPPVQAQAAHSTDPYAQGNVMNNPVSALIDGLPAAGSGIKIAYAKACVSSATGLNAQIGSGKNAGASIGQLVTARDALYRQGADAAAGATGNDSAKIAIFTQYLGAAKSIAGSNATATSNDLHAYAVKVLLTLDDKALVTRTLMGLGGLGKNAGSFLGAPSTAQPGQTPSAAPAPMLGNVPISATPQLTPKQAAKAYQGDKRIFAYDKRLGTDTVAAAAQQARKFERQAAAAAPSVAQHEFNVNQQQRAAVDAVIKKLESAEGFDPRQAQQFIAQLEPSAAAAAKSNETIDGFAQQYLTGQRQAVDAALTSVAAGVQSTEAADAVALARAHAQIGYAAIPTGMQLTPAQSQSAFQNAKILAQHDAIVEQGNVGAAKQRAQERKRQALAAAPQVARREIAANEQRQIEAASAVEKNALLEHVNPSQVRQAITQLEQSARSTAKNPATLRSLERQYVAGQRQAADAAVAAAAQTARRVEGTDAAHLAKVRAQLGYVPLQRDTSSGAKAPATLAFNQIAAPHDALVLQAEHAAAVQRAKQLYAQQISADKAASKREIRALPAGSLRQDVTIGERADEQAARAQELRTIGAANANQKRDLAALRKTYTALSGKAEGTWFTANPKSFSRLEMNRFAAQRDGGRTYAAGTQLNNLVGRVFGIAPDNHSNPQGTPSADLYSGKTLAALAPIVNQIQKVGGKNAQLLVVPVAYDSGGTVKQTVLFQVQNANGNGSKFIDDRGYSYTSISDYQHNNALPGGTMVVLSTTADMRINRAANGDAGTFVGTSHIGPGWFSSAVNTVGGVGLAGVGVVAMAAGAVVEVATDGAATPLVVGEEELAAGLVTGEVTALTADATVEGIAGAGALGSDATGAVSGLTGEAGASAAPAADAATSSANAARSVVQNATKLGPKALGKLVARRAFEVSMPFGVNGAASSILNLKDHGQAWAPWSGGTATADWISGATSVAASGAFAAGALSSRMTVAADGLAKTGHVLGMAAFAGGTQQLVQQGAGLVGNFNWAAARGFAFSLGQMAAGHMAYAGAESPAGRLAEPNPIVAQGAGIDPPKPPPNQAPGPEVSAAGTAPARTATPAKGPAAPAADPQTQSTTQGARVRTNLEAPPERVELDASARRTPRAQLARLGHRAAAGLHPSRPTLGRGDAGAPSAPSAPEEPLFYSLDGRTIDSLHHGWFGSELNPYRKANKLFSTARNLRDWYGNLPYHGMPGAGSARKPDGYYSRDASDLTLKGARAADDRNLNALDPTGPRGRLRGLVGRPQVPDGQKDLHLAGVTSISTAENSTGDPGAEFDRFMGNHPRLAFHFGELTTIKEVVSHKLGAARTILGDKLRTALTAARVRGIPVYLHVDSGAVTYDEHRLATVGPTDRRYFGRAIRLMQEQGAYKLSADEIAQYNNLPPEARAAWLKAKADEGKTQQPLAVVIPHLALGKFVRLNAPHLQALRDVLADPLLAHVKFDASWTDVIGPIADDPQMTEQVAQLIFNHPGRFVHATDMTGADNPVWYNRYNYMAKPLHDRLYQLAEAAGQPRSAEDVTSVMSRYFGGTAAEMEATARERQAEWKRGLAARAASGAETSLTPKQKSNLQAWADQNPGPRPRMALAPPDTPAAGAAPYAPIDENPDLARAYFNALNGNARYPSDIVKRLNEPSLTQPLAGEPISDERTALQNPTLLTRDELNGIAPIPGSIALPIWALPRAPWSTEALNAADPQLTYHANPFSQIDAMARTEVRERAGSVRLANEKVGNAKSQEAFDRKHRAGMVAAAGGTAGAVAFLKAVHPAFEMPVNAGIFAARSGIALSRFVESRRYVRVADNAADGKMTVQDALYARDRLVNIASRYGSFQPWRIKAIKDAYEPLIEALKTGSLETADSLETRKNIAGEYGKTVTDVRTALSGYGTNLDPRSSRTKFGRKLGYAQSASYLLNAASGLANPSWYQLLFAGDNAALAIREGANAARGATPDHIKEHTRFRTFLNRVVGPTYAAAGAGLFAKAGGFTALSSFAHPIPALGWGIFTLGASASARYGWLDANNVRVEPKRAAFASAVVQGGILLAVAPTIVSAVSAMSAALFGPSTTIPGTMPATTPATVTPPTTAPAPPATTAPAPPPAKPEPQRKPKTHQEVVTARDGVYAYADPTLGARIVGALRDGTFVQATGLSRTDQSGQRLDRVALGKGHFGWVAARYLSPHPVGATNASGRYDAGLAAKGYSAITVRPGNTISSIAASKNANVRETIALNLAHIPDPNVIYPGDVIYLPKPLP